MLNLLPFLSAADNLFVGYVLILLVVGTGAGGPKIITQTINVSRINNNMHKSMEYKHVNNTK